MFKQTFLFPILLLLNACSTTNQKEPQSMNNTKIIAEVKKAADALSTYSASSQLDSLLACYADVKDFRAFSADGIMRNFDEFRKIATGFYDSVSRQQVSTIREDFSVIDSNLVIVSWLGNIDAFFKNGNTMKMKNYGVTFVFKKIDNQWKVIHSHESSLPPEILKASEKK